MRFSPPKMDFSREETAEREIGRTSVRPFVRRFLVAALLLTLVAVPAAQYVHEAVRTRQLKPRALKFLSAFPAAGQAYARADGIAGGVDAASASLRRDFKAFEKSLEDESLLVRHALPPVQEFAARFLGLGNEKVYLGREGWLFYRPDVDYVAGAGFLDPAVLRERGRGSGIHPDPLPALVRFREDLAARGIRLLVVPVQTEIRRKTRPSRNSSRNFARMESTPSTSPRCSLRTRRPAGPPVFSRPIHTGPQGRWNARRNS